MWKSEDVFTFASIETEQVLYWYMTFQSEFLFFPASK